MSGKMIWVLVKRWPGGRFEHDSAYETEEDARFAASKLLGDTYWLNLETIRMGDSITVELPEAQKTL
jgi:hypothetical protein